MKFNYWYPHTFGDCIKTNTLNWVGPAPKNIFSFCFIYLMNMSLHVNNNKIIMNSWHNYHLLSVWSNARHLVCIAHNKSMREMSLCSFSKWGRWGLAKSNMLPKITQQTKYKNKCLNCAFSYWGFCCHVCFFPPQDIFYLLSQGSFSFIISYQPMLKLGQGAWSPCYFWKSMLPSQGLGTYRFQHPSLLSLATSLFLYFVISLLHVTLSVSFPNHSV